jgi:membrane protease YdiL (CAAX protease family)
MDTKESALSKLWSNIPLLIRAIILGIIVSSIGVLIWPLIAIFIPLPWSFVIMIGFLVFYFKFFSGETKPKSTQVFRKNNFRNKKLSSRVWAHAIIAIFLIVIIEQSSLVVTFRIIEFPAEIFAQEYSFLQNIPIWAGWLVIIMISVVAGICEEIGFRGYMQVPLENKYGPLKAIIIVSLMFVVVHLHQAWSGPIVFHIFFISVLFGSIAYYSKSLIPGIIAHSIMDICNFSFWWSDLGFQFNERPIKETGFDLHLALWIVILMLSIGFFIQIMKKLNKLS